MNKSGKNNNFCHIEGNVQNKYQTEPFQHSHQNDRYTAFTFAELMVSLVIIAIITALLYPTIAEISPNNNKQLFRSAYKTIELTVEDIITASPTGELPATTEDLCKEFKKRLNAVSFINSANSSDSGCTSSPYLLQTSNGMRWYFQDYTDPTHTIFVDVNAANNGSSYTSMDCDNCSGNNDPENFCNGTSSNIWKTGCFRKGNSTVRDTFKIQIDKSGKVNINNDSIGLKHLKDEE